MACDLLIGEETVQIMVDEEINSFFYNFSIKKSLSFLLLVASICVIFASHNSILLQKICWFQLLRGFCVKHLRTVFFSFYFIYLHIIN